MKKQTVLLISSLFMTLSLPIFANSQKPAPMTCNQVYIDNPKLANTPEQCAAQWKRFVHQKDVVMQAIMVVDGLGGQKQDPHRALELARKHRPGDGYADLELIALKADIKQRIKNPALLKTPITYCKDVVSSGEGLRICQYIGAGKNTVS